ncbi:MAG: ABC transporter ATP-binding protein, partial [Bdellovibrionales bacterium]|nr:ABC transporter ATP-binding protein [Bdellovibrionales bacterium]
ENRVSELLEIVGLKSTDLNKYPHEFSGGQRQRIGIARAIALNPELIICDEPVSALDVSIQAQVLNLLKELQQKMNLTYLFISHDLSVIEHICDEIAVMYLGRIVERAERNELFAHPTHPYTRALLASIPRIGAGKVHRHSLLSGEVPSPINPPSGCTFRTRCPIAQNDCAEHRPQLNSIESKSETKHLVSCWHHERIKNKEDSNEVQQKAGSSSFASDSVAHATL